MSSVRHPLPLTLSRATPTFTHRQPPRVSAPTPRLNVLRENVGVGWTRLAASRLGVPPPASWWWRTQSVSRLDETHEEPRVCLHGGVVYWEPVPRSM